MDEGFGEALADVLIEDGQIAAVGSDLDVAEVDMLDITGNVVMPGFVDTHRHTCQTPPRPTQARPRRRH